MVDDSAPDRNLCRILLEETQGSDLEFWEASGAAGGLETCRNVSPDCILLDYKLPDMSGLEFLTKLHSHDPSEAPSFAVVMLTGLASEQVAVEAMKAGAQDYLVKDQMTAEGLSLAITKATQKVSLIRALNAERDSLAQSLAEKEVLLKEIHHRVKNNLQVIGSLLRLQASKIGDDRLALALRESQHRVDSMALIHEQLYETQDLRRVDLARHAETLAANLFYSYAADPARIRRQVFVHPLEIGVDAAIPVGLILNELISNALKHAFPGRRAGTIAVEGFRRDGLVILEVRDDGVGLPEDPAAGSPGSLGLEIVNILTRQLKGMVEIDRTRGTTFRICFPER